MTTKTAREITGALSGTWHGRYGTAPCPVCQPERRKGQNALTLSDGTDRLLAHCKKSGCDFRDILKAAGVTPGTAIAPDPAIRAQRAAEERAEAEKRAMQAATIWNETIHINGTSAEAYLRRRGIDCPLPVVLRFHASCWHGPTARRHPALVALVEGGDRFSVHRTYLLPDGSGKAQVSPAKMMLGPTGGGAVRLTAGGAGLVVAEGIETALSLACGLLPERMAIWAALSTSGLRGLRLPDDPGRLIVAPDGDSAGRAAAHELAERAHALGWRVELLPAPDGRDWNDMLLREVQQ